MLKRITTMVLVLSLIVLSSATVLAASGGNGNGSGGQSAAGNISETSEGGGDASNSLGQNTSNMGESTQLEGESAGQKEKGNQASGEQDQTMEQTRDRLQTMLKDQEITAEEWDEIKAGLTQVKALYREKTESREEVKNLFKLALQECRQMQNTQETRQLLEDIIAIDPKSSDAYQELGNIFKNQGDERCHLWFDGRELKSEVPPVIKQGRTLVPVRAITEALGAEVQWKESERTVLISKGETVIQLQVENRIATVNGQPVELDCQTENINSRVLVPLRFIGETLKAEVQYYPEGKIISINEQ